MRDEQIYLAHKCANPAKYAPPTEFLTEKGKTLLNKYKPTDVQLQVWDDMCHVGPTLSFTRPAKHMYRSVAQFGAWALARAQNRGIEIMDDDNISIISSSTTSDEGHEGEGRSKEEREAEQNNMQAGAVGKAGDPLPPFKNHMIREQVTRHGKIFPLKPESELPGCCMGPDSIGVVKSPVVKRWLKKKMEWDRKFASAKAKVHGKVINDMVVGYRDLGEGENPPPTALAGHWRLDSELRPKSRRKSLGLALWSLWGSKHDEATVQREENAKQEPETEVVDPDDGRGARHYSDIAIQEPATNGANGREVSRNRSRSRVVSDENQTEEPYESTLVAQLLEMRKQRESEQSGLLGPDYAPPTGAAGKRPFLDGIAVPFTLKKEADTASMMTLDSSMSPPATSRSVNPLDLGQAGASPKTTSEETAQAQVQHCAAGKRSFLDGETVPFTVKKEAETASMMTLNSNMSPPATSRSVNPLDLGQAAASPKTTSEETAQAQVQHGAAGTRSFFDGETMPFTVKKEAETASMVTLNSNISPPATLHPVNPLDLREAAAPPDNNTEQPAKAQNGAATRPELESFVTAEEGVPKAEGQNGGAKTKE